MDRLIEIAIRDEDGATVAAEPGENDPRAGGVLTLPLEAAGGAVEVDLGAIDLARYLPLDLDGPAAAAVVLAQLWYAVSGEEPDAEDLRHAWDTLRDRLSVPDGVLLDTREDACPWCFAQRLLAVAGLVCTLVDHDLYASGLADHPELSRASHQIWGALSTLGRVVETTAGAWDEDAEDDEDEDAA